MINLIGIKHNIEVEIRERLAALPWKVEKYLNEILMEFDEAVLVNTCNRTEIYFTTTDINDEASEDDQQHRINKLYEILGWKTQDIEHTFHISGINAQKHLLEVVCGFHSKILGEEQILGQIKDAYEISLKNMGVKGKLQKLFQIAVTCGKEFRLKSEICYIPISSASIVVREARKKCIKKFMILGYGEIGVLACKYIIDGEFEVLYIAARDKNKAHEECSLGISEDIIKDKIKIIDFDDRKTHYKEVECIISCTASPHIVVKAEDLPLKNYTIFDLAVPRDVDEKVSENTMVELYDIDSISLLHDENHLRRKVLMNENKTIIEKYLKKYEDFIKTKDLLPHIHSIKKAGHTIHNERYESYKNKRSTNNDIELAKLLLKSTSDFYVNKAIEVLREEHIKGKGQECIDILNRIFKI